MSYQATTRIWQLDLPHSEAWVLMALAEHANEQGAEIYPGITLIAWKTGYSTRQVQRVINSLASKGVLVLQERGVGKYKTNEYRIDWSACRDKEPIERKAAGRPVADKPNDNLSPDLPIYSDNLSGDIGDKSGDISGKWDDIAMSPKPSIKPSVKESLKGRGVVNPRATATAPPPLRPVPKDYSSRKPGQLPNGHHANSPPAPRATTLPPDFQLTSEMEQMAVELAEANGVRLDVKMAFRKFVGHFTRGKGRETALENWEWRFETWIIDDIAKAPPAEQAQTNQRGANGNAKDQPTKFARAANRVHKELFGFGLDEISTGGAGDSHEDNQRGALYQLPKPSS